ncbi:MAG: murein biosynthesis integral membrane protein MurJ [Candidatus Wallbacteria bacterium]|nr:murein biosynthesis integral membrane protein MurJ [Candidatus Wallbacteria bacterium]
MSRKLRNIGIFSFFTIISRLLGFVRVILFTLFFGTSEMFEAFLAAFQIPNFFRMTFGEGALNGAVVPIYTEVRLKRGDEEAHRLASSVILSLSFLFLIMTLIVLIFTPQVTYLFLPGFAKTPLKFWMSVLLLKIMFPYLIFIGLAAVTMAFLNSTGKFAVSAFSPCLLNLVFIVYIFCFLPEINDPVLKLTLLGLTALIGGALQFFLQQWWFKRIGFRFTPVLWHPELARILKLFLPTALIYGASQINLMVSRMIASFLPSGSISYLYFANHLLQLPMGVFSVAIVSVSLPMLSEATAGKRDEAVAANIQSSLLLNYFLMVPLAILIYLQAAPMVQFVFERGKFSHLDTLNTAWALKYYAVGLFFFSINRLLESVFYAFRDPKTPLKVAICTIIMNIGLNLLLVKPFLHAGLAMGNSLAAIFQSFALVYGLSRHVPLRKVFTEALNLGIWKITLMNLLLVLVIYALDSIFAGAGVYFKLTAIIGISAILYLAAGYFLGVTEILRRSLRES